MKHRLRKDMKAALAAMAAEDAAAASRAACAAAVALEEFRDARAVMLYSPIPGEVDCVPIARAAWGAGKIVLLPKVLLAERRMTPVRWLSADDEMRVGSFGIGEPASGEAWPIEEIDLIVVPAVAYDRAGRRLGRGGGFYDRFLAQSGLRAVTCGLAFARQVVEELPAEPHDYPVEIVVTDREVFRINRCSD
jgi:5-formyltetrahydrofolate cyclo-ligase